MPFGIFGTCVMLANFLPIAAGHVIEPQRRGRGFRLPHIPVGLLRFAALYRFGFALVPTLCRAEKAMTSDFEVILPVQADRPDWPASAVYPVVLAMILQIGCPGFRSSTWRSARYRFRDRTCYSIAMPPPQA